MYVNFFAKVCDVYAYEFVKKILKIKEGEKSAGLTYLFK